MYTQGDSDVISLYHIYASCFFAILWGKLWEILVAFLAYDTYFDRSTLLKKDFKTTKTTKMFFISERLFQGVITLMRKKYLCVPTLQWLEDAPVGRGNFEGSL